MVEFEAWVHGAVLRPLYFKYADFGYNNINIDAQRANKIQEEVERILPSRKLTLIDKVLGKYALYTADELERLNHGEDPWCKARACLGADEIGKNIITTDSMKDYYRSKAVEKGMRTMKKDKFNFSSARLKKAQEELKNKEVFKVTEDNAEEYKEFILKSQKENALLARRAEYAQALQDK